MSTTSAGDNRVEELRALLAAIVESSDDAIVSKTLEGRITSWNQGAERIFGYSADEVIGRSIALLVPPSQSEDVPHILGTISRGERVDHYETKRVRKDGQVIDVSVTVSPIRDATGTIIGASKVARDITARKRMEKRISAQHAVSGILAESATLSQGIEGVLQELCRQFEWDIGGFWMIDREENLLRCVEIWNEPSVNIPELEADALKRTLSRGVGLPGRAWSTGRLFWIENAVDDVNFPRATLAAQAGLRGAFGFPIRLEREVLGVMEFFSRETRPLHDELLETMAAIGSQIGQFMERKRAEEELRRKQQELTDFIENAIVGLRWLGPDGTILWANQAELDLLGYTREEYIGHNITEFHADEPVIQDILRRLTNNEELHSYEARLRCKDGSIRHVLISSNVYRVDGHFKHTRCFTRDITDRKRAEEAIRQQQESWRVTLSSIGDAVLVTDARGRITFMNPVAQSLCGWAHEEAAGKPLPEVFRIINEQTRAPAEDPVAKVLDVGRIMGLANHTILVAKDGTERPIEDSAAPIRDDSGQVRGVVVVFHDDTTRRRAEQALRESEARFRTMADSAPVLIWLADTAKLCTYFNRPWLDFTGRTLDEEVGNGWAEGIHPNDYERSLRTYNAAFDAREPFEIDFRLRRYDGEYRWIVDKALPLFTPGGDFAGYIGSCIDITERKQALNALREADRRKDEFLAMLAHELRNPLASISGAVQVIRRSQAEESLEWAREVLERQVKNLAHLVDDLLDVSRITRGKIELRKEFLDAPSILNAAIEAVWPLIKERKHELSVSSSPGNLQLEGDPLRLEQILVNLLTNAAKYTETGGRISVFVEREGEAVVFRVQDTGIGIPSDMLPHIFELFAQGERSIARSEGGLGIGLTLVKRLAELHGGSVTAASEGPGKGSEFTVRLPVATKPRVTGPKAAAPPSNEATLRSCRVLVVDDNVDTARGLRRFLTLLGHDVKTAHDGPSALEAARAHRPEVVLLDIGLPGMDGYHLAAKLRAEECCKDACLIAVTGYGQEEDRGRSRAAGFDHHLVKPVDHDALVAILEQPAMHH